MSAWQSCTSPRTGMRCRESDRSRPFPCGSPTKADYVLAWEGVSDLVVFGQVVPQVGVFRFVDRLEGRPPESSQGESEDQDGSEPGGDHASDEEGRSAVGSREGERAEVDRRLIGRRVPRIDGK